MSNDGIDSNAQLGGKTLSDAVYQQIYQRISQGDWPKGTRLPTEIDLAEQFGVSRTVIREALLRLRIDGLIASRQGAGTHVIASPNRRVLDFSEPSSVADLQRCYEFRVGVEGEAARLAARNNSPDRLADIEQALQAMDACIANNGLGADEDVAFHLAIARASENDYYVRTVESVIGAIRVGISIAATFFNTNNNTARLQVAQSEHRTIYEAVRQQEPDKALNLMQAHIESARRRVFVGR